MALPQPPASISFLAMNAYGLSPGSLTHGPHRLCLVALKLLRGCIQKLRRLVSGVIAHAQKLTALRICMADLWTQPRRRSTAKSSRSS